MLVAQELHPIASDLAIWHLYDPAVKAELFSTALATRSGIFLVDPTPLAETALAGFVRGRPIAGIIITNGNHYRSSGDYADKLAVPIFASRNSLVPQSPPHFVEVAEGARIGDELEVISIEGAAPGEIVLFRADSVGTLIVGDALINFEPYGFTFLPAKYCANQKEMRRSLRNLLNYAAERILFAHGTPILSKASERIRRLLDTVP